MMLNVQLRVMVYLKSNNPILPQGEKEGRSVYINDTYVDIIAYALNVVESITFYL